MDAGKLVPLMLKRKVWQDNCNSVALHVYVATNFSPRNGLIYLRKTKERKTSWCEC